MLLNIYRHEKVVYNLTVNELYQTCDELSSHLKNMSFYNIRNSRTAEMINEIDQASKQHDEKSEFYWCNIITYIN